MKRRATSECNLNLDSEDGDASDQILLPRLPNEIARKVIKLSPRWKIPDLRGINRLWMRSISPNPSWYRSDANIFTLKACENKKDLFCDDKDDHIYIIQLMLAQRLIPSRETTRHGSTVGPSFIAEVLHDIDEICCSGGNRWLVTNSDDEDPSEEGFHLPCAFCDDPLELDEFVSNLPSKIFVDSKPCHESCLRTWSEQVASSFQWSLIRAYQERFDMHTPDGMEKPTLDLHTSSDIEVYFGCFRAKWLRLYHDFWDFRRVWGPTYIQELDKDNERSLDISENSESSRSNSEESSDWAEYHNSNYDSFDSSDQSEHDDDEDEDWHE